MMPETLLNSFSTRLAAPITAGDTSCVVTAGVPAAAVGSSARVVFYDLPGANAEIVLATFDTATSWSLVRAVEDAARFPARAWPVPTTSADAVLTSGGLAAVVGPLAGVTVGAGLALAGGVLTANVRLDTANTWTGDQTHVGALIAHELRNADDSAFVTLAEDELRLHSAGTLTVTATTGLVVVNSGLSTGALIVEDVATVATALQTPTLRDLDLTVEINLSGGVAAVVGDLTVTGVVTGDGAGLTGLVVPTQTSGQSVLAADFLITAADAVFQDVGLEVALPEAGTYLITYNVRVTVWTSAGSGYIVVRLYDETAAAEVADTRRLTYFPSDTVNRQVHSAYSAIFTVASPRTIRLEASSNGAPTWTARRIASDSNGRTTLGFVKLA